MSPPVAIAPVGGVTVTCLKLIFSWTPVSGTTGYTLQVSRVNSYSSLLINVSISPTASSYTSGSNLPADISDGLIDPDARQQRPP
ncbi:MAG: hypothetical protein ABSA01_13190 [Anaerolineales bacterium]